jgi:hypothetical protein
MIVKDSNGLLADLRPGDWVLVVPMHVEALVLDVAFTEEGETATVFWPEWRTTLDRLVSDSLVKLVPTPSTRAGS